MALAPLKPVTKDEFLSEGGKKTLPLPKGTRKIKKLSDRGNRAFKLLTFGPTGSGKTRQIVGLLLHGFKVFVVSSDIGGDGLNTVEMELRRLGRPELIDNCTFDVIDDAQEIKKFLADPLNLYPDFYEQDLDWLVWDGFSSFQQNQLPIIVGEMVGDKISMADKEIATVREDGLQFEIADWGIFRNMTVRACDSFLRINNLKTGKVWNKIITCLEGIKAVVTNSGPGGLAATSYKETREPFLQGSAIKLVGPAFDLILNTRYDGGKYSYLRNKSRGVELPEVNEADMYKLWENISGQLALCNTSTTGQAAS